MNIQNRMDSSLMMDRAVRKERQKLRSHTRNPTRYPVRDNSNYMNKLISKNQDADKTGTDMLVKGADIIRSAYISKEVSKKEEEAFKKKKIDKSDEQTQKEWERMHHSGIAILLNSLKRIKYRCDD